MKKVFCIAVATVCFAVFCNVNPLYANITCPDYTIYCEDGTAHGPYGTCWHTKQLMCLPCSDNNASVCENHRGPKCILFSSDVTDLVVVYLCHYLHIPTDKCFVCATKP